MLKTLLKWLSIILCFTVVFTLTSCSDEVDDNRQDDNNNTQEEQPNNNQDQNKESDGKNEQDQTHIGELPWI